MLEVKQPLRRDMMYFRVLIVMVTVYKFVKEKLKVWTVKEDVHHHIAKD